MDRVRALARGFLARRAAGANRVPFEGLPRVPWDVVLEFVIEIDETTSAGLEVLGRLANCNRVLRECLALELRERHNAVLVMTHSFIVRRIQTTMWNHPHIILRGRLWYSLASDPQIGGGGWDYDSVMHREFVERVIDFQRRLLALANRVHAHQGARHARAFVVATVGAFQVSPLMDIEGSLRMLAQDLTAMFGEA